MSRGTRVVTAVLRASLTTLAMALAGCGGGGGGSGSGADGGGGSARSAAPPVIVGALLAFPASAFPPSVLSSGGPNATRLAARTAVTASAGGANALAQVSVNDPGSGLPITNATVSLNGTPLAYIAANQDYEAELRVDPGADVSLSVSTSAGRFGASGRQFGTYPTITAPASDTSWSTQSPSLVAWTGVTPTSTALYAVLVVDSSGNLVWPTGVLGLQTVAPPAASFLIPPNSLSAGSSQVLVGVVDTLSVASADSRSALLLGAFSFVSVNVAGPPVVALASIAISPAPAAVAKGGTHQLVATGTYTDNSRSDLSTQVTWASSAPAMASVDAAGLATGLDGGSVTITASLGAVSGSSELTVWQPTASAMPPLSQAVAYQIDDTHSGYAVFPQPVELPPTAAWSTTLPGPPSYPLVADGKVFVTVADPAFTSGTSLYALNEQTGAIAWGPRRIPGRDFWSALAYEKGKVFVINADGVLGSFDGATGEPGWSLQLPGQYAFSAPPAAANGLVYVGGAGTGGTLYAVDETGGGLLWSSRVDNGDVSSPAVTADGVFVSYPCQVYKLDPFSGATLWHYAGGCEGGGGATPVYGSGRLYVQDQDAGGLIFNAATGERVGGFGAGLPPALTPQIQYQTIFGVLNAIDVSTRQTVWSFAGVGSNVSMAPIVVNDVVFVGTLSGTLYALDASTGAQRWSTETGASLLTQGSGNQPPPGLAAGEGYLVVPAGNAVMAWRIVAP